MTAAAFIDLVLTPISVGIGGGVGGYWAARRRHDAQTARMMALVIGIGAAVLYGGLKWLG